MGTVAQVDQYLTPANSQMAAGSASIKIIPWQFGVIQGIQSKKIRSSTGYFQDLSAIKALTAAINSLTSGSGTTLIDSTGLVSTASFINSTITDATQHTTTNTSATDIPGASMSPFILSRTTNVLMLVSLNAYAYNAASDGSTARIRLVDSVSGTLADWFFSSYWYINSIIQDTSKNVTGWSLTSGYEFFTFASIFTLAAGSHTLKLQYYVSGTGTTDVGLYTISYIILGS